MADRGAPRASGSRRRRRPHLLLALAYEREGRYPEALTALDETDPEWRIAGAVAMRGRLYARVGRVEDARRALEYLKGELNTTVSPFQEATIYVALGEHDRAVDLLERAVRDRAWLVQLLKVEPNFDPLREQPRFRALLRKVGLVEADP